MRSYGSYLAGAPEDGAGWVYWPRIGALLDQPYEVMALKARLENGDRPDPDDPRLAGRVALSTPEQHDRAVRLARQAQPAWARVPLARRLDLLHAFRERLREHRDECVDLFVAEGHPYRLARWETACILTALHPDSIAYAAGQLAWHGTTGGRAISLLRKPDGVVCVIPPRNAAGSNSVLLLWALAAGNSVVLNAPSACPLSVHYLYQELLGPLLGEHGVPPGALAVLCGQSRPAVRDWLTHPDVADIFFFGSSEAGLAVERQCVEHGKKPVLELSGNDGLVVWRDAEVELAAGALSERFVGSGQICMLPKFALVHPAVAAELVERVAAIAAGLTPRFPEDAQSVLAPVVRRGDFQEVLAEALDAGVELVAGGRLLDVHGKEDPAGPFVEPTVLIVRGLAAAEKLRAVREETFFPLLCVVVPDDPDDEQLLTAAIDFLNRNPYGLRNSLWARDPGVIERFCAEVTNGGILKVNDSHLNAVPGLPTHGGTGRTGGVFGEANQPMLRTTHLQAVSIATEVRPRADVLDFDVLT